MPSRFLALWGAAPWRFRRHSKAGIVSGFLPLDPPVNSFANCGQKLPGFCALVQPARAPLQSRRASDYPAVFDLLLAYYLSSNYHRFFVGINAQSRPRKHAEQPGQHKPWHFPSFSDIFNHGIAVATIPRLRKHSMPSSLAKAPCHTLGEMRKRNPAARCSRSSAYPARQRGQQGNPEQHLALPRKRTARSDLHGVDFKVVSARKHATLYSASSLCEDLCRRLCARFS